MTSQERHSQAENRAEGAGLRVPLEPVASPGEETGTEAPPPTPAKRRLRRLLWRALLAGGGLVAALLLLLWFALSHIGHPLVKIRIVRAAANAGIALDFDDASASLTQLHLRGLRVLQPAPDRAGPPLLTIDRLDVRYGLWRMIQGRLPKIRDLTLDGLHVALYLDDDGSSSITRLLKALPPSPPKSAAPPTPLSETLASLTDLPVIVDGLHVQNVDATVIGRASGHEVEHTKFSGLELAFSVGHGKLDLALTTPPAGALLDQQREAEHHGLLADAKLRLAFDSHAQPGPLGNLSIDLKLRDQDLVPLPPHAPPISQVLALDANFVPDVRHGKTTVKVDRLQLLDGAGTGSLDADLLDGSFGNVKARIRKASLNVRLDPLRGFVPDTFGDLQELSGAVKLEVDGADLSRLLDLSAQGTAEAEVDLSRLRWQQGTQSVDLSGLKLDLHGKPVADGVELEATVPLQAVKAKLPGTSVTLAKSKAQLHAKITKEQRVTGKLSATFDELQLEGDQHLSAHNAAFNVALTNAGQAAGPLHFTGDVKAEASIGSLTALSHGQSVTTTDLNLSAPLHAKTADSGSTETHLTLASLTVHQGKSVLLAPSPARLDLKIPHFKYAVDPLQSLAELTTELSFGAWKVKAHVEKSAQELRYDASAGAESLAMLRSFVSAPIPWETVGLAFESKGTVSHLEAGPAMQLSQDTTVRLDHAAFLGEGMHLRAKQLVARLTAKGTMNRHEASGTMHLTGLRIVGKDRPGEEDVKLHLTVDRTQPKLDLKFEAAGEACPEGHLDLSFAFDRAHKRITYATDAALSHLELIPELLPKGALGPHRIEWKPLTVQVSGHGELDGVVTAFHALKPVMAADPLKTLSGAQTLALTMNGIKYHDASQHSADLDSLRLAVDATESGEQRHAVLKLTVPNAVLHNADEQVTLEGFSPTLTVDQWKDSGRARLQLALASATQPFYPYNIGDVSLNAVIISDAQGALRLESAKLVNAAGGTTLEASGRIETLPIANLPWQTASTAVHHRGAKFDAVLSQQLERLPEGGQITGRGLAKVNFAAESSDLQLEPGKDPRGVFHTTTTIAFNNADVKLPSRNLSVKKLNARIPIKHDRLLEAGQFKYLGGAKAAVYPRERFFDYQPFLGTDDYLTVDQVSLGALAFGPIAGNLRVDRNLIALDQLEMSALGGKMTGQLLVDYDPDDQEASEVTFRGNITGVAPAKSHGEKRDEVDANAALKLNLRRQELEGKIDVVRLSRDDLRALLDSWDPYHANASANRTRKALALGYPKEVRLLFHQGFAKLKVQLGGLAGAVNIDLTQSTGPMLEQYVAPYLRPRSTP